MNNSNSAARKTNKAAVEVMIALLANAAEQAVEMAIELMAPSGIDDTKEVLEMVAKSMADSSGVTLEIARLAVQRGMIASASKKGIDLSSSAVFS